MKTFEKKKIIYSPIFTNVKIISNFASIYCKRNLVLVLVRYIPFIAIYVRIINIEAEIVDGEHDRRDGKTPYEHILKILLDHGSTSFTYEHIAVRR